MRDGNEQLVTGIWQRKKDTEHESEVWVEGETGAGARGEEEKWKTVLRAVAVAAGLPFERWNRPEGQTKRVIQVFCGAPGGTGPSARRIRAAAAPRG